MKSWYGNNAEKLKPITDILVNVGKNAANNAINKGLNYVNNKTGSDTMKQIANVVDNIANDTMSNVANQIQGKVVQGSGYDISDLDDETNPTAVSSKEKRIESSQPFLRTRTRYTSR